MLLEILQRLGGWSWWVLGLALLGIEVLAPGMFFLWFGVAAILIGTSALLIDWPWQLQVIGFLVLSVVAALVGRRFAGANEAEPADPHLNNPARRLEGRTFVLAEPIVNGAGRLRVDGSLWLVRGPDMPAGARVVVTGSDASVLTVENA